MLAGQPPFRGSSALELAIHHVQSPPQPLGELRPDLPAELCAIVHKMMAKSVDERYQTCNDLLKALARLRESLSGQNTPAAGALPAAMTQAAPEQPVAAASRRRRGLWVAALAGILLAFLGGGAAAWFRYRNLRAQVGGPEAHADTRLTEEQQRERFLLEAVGPFADLAGDARKLDLEMGLGHRLELGLFYLKHNRLEDADKFFAGLVRDPHSVEAYKTLGRLGQAVVLARQNRPAESNQAFQELFRDARARKNGVDRLPFLLSQPELRREIGLALDYNKANASASMPFPNALENLRQPPKWLVTSSP
jgi:eukaryotic-like serine/threonine-protein kinase